MARADSFKVEGAVIEALPNRTYRVELANGHRLLAYVTGKARLNFPRLVAGEKVMLELSPYDLSEGRIITEKERKLV